LARERLGKADPAGAAHTTHESEVNAMPLWAWILIIILIVLLLTGGVGYGRR
jgi:hypothetical protein